MIPNRTLDAVTKGREGFRYDEDGTFTGADGREAVDLYTLIVLHSYLQLQIKTNMRFRVNLLAKANEVLGTNYKRRQQALDHLGAVLRSAGELGGPEGPQS